MAMRSAAPGHLDLAFRYFECSLEQLLRTVGAPYLVGVRCAVTPLCRATVMRALRFWLGSGAGLVQEDT
jgi:hypothetical protein